MCTEISNQKNNKEMAWPEKDLCIKCDRGGKVLVCSDSNCPIIVHEKCMGGPAKFDDRGNFYCPYCLYRQANAQVHKAREDAMFKKQALSSFLDKDMIIGEKLVQPSMRKSPSERAEESSPEERTGFLQSKCNNYSRENHCDNHLTAVGRYKAQSGPIVACGSESSSGEQGSTQNFRVVQVGKRVQAEHESEVDGQQIDRDVEDRQEDGHSSEMPEREKRVRKKSKQMLEENEPEVDDQQIDRDLEDGQQDGHLSEIPEREKKIRKRSKRVLAENELEVDDLQLDRGVENHQEDVRLSEIPEREKKMRKKAKRVLPENEPEVDGQQLDRGFEDHQEDGHLSEIPEREKKIRKKAQWVLAENEPEADGQQLDRGFEDHQEDGHLSKIPEREKKIRKKAKRVLAEKEPEVDGQQLDRGFEDHQEDGHLSEIPEREKKVRKKAKQMRAENEPEVDDLQLDKDVEDHQEDGHLSEIPERGKTIRKKEQMLAENEPVVDDQLLDRDVEDCQEDGHLGEIPEREENFTNKAIQMQDERKENEAGGGAETEKMQQGKTRESAASFVNEDPKSQLHLRAKRRVETDASTSRECEADLRRSNRLMEKKPDIEKKIRKRAKRMLAENEQEVDDKLVDRDVEDGHLREKPERREIITKKAVQMQAERKENKAGGGAEAEEMQGKTHESAASFVNEDPGPQLHLKTKRRVETFSSTSKYFEAVLRRSNRIMKKKPEREKKIRMPAENEPEVDDQVLDRDVEDCQEDGHMREIPEREKNVTKKATQMQAERTENEAGGGAEAEQMQGKTRESAAPFMNEEPESQLHLKTKKRVETGASTSTEFEAVLRRSNRTTEKKSMQMQAERTENEAGGGAEAEQMQGKTRESAAPFMNEEPESQLHLKTKRRVETGASTSREFEAVLRRSNRTTEKKSTHMQAERTENEAGGGAVAEQMQGKTRESAASFVNEEPESELHLKTKRRVETGASTSREFEAVLRRSNRTTEKKSTQMQSERTENEAGGGAEAEQMQGKTHESAASFVNEEPESELHLKTKKRVETGASTSREFEAVLRRSNRTTEKKSTQMQSERTENEAGGGAEAEQMQGKTRESTAPFVNEEPESQLNLKAKRRVETGASPSREFEAVMRRYNYTKKKNEIEDHPLNSDSKRSSRTACTTRKPSGKTGETSASDKLKKDEAFSTWLRSQFPNGRRKKLMWSEEEEEMLKEGVRKYTAIINKNIPWRKILEIGQHVFDPTRTPADLKDKWRTTMWKVQ